MSTLFISDLHLDPSRPAVTRAFLDLLAQQTHHIDALYILGDFFEAWIGDDESDPLHEQVKQALRLTTDSGTPIFIMHGNRDFLMGDDFCQQTGCLLIEDPSVVELYGHKVLLMHGDSLCTADSSYMEFRATVRSDAWKKDVLNRSLEERRVMAKKFREASMEAQSNKAEDIVDVTPSEITKVMNNNNVNLLIHGHTHRPAIHTVALDGGTEGKRIVLGDWDDHGWLLRYENTGQYELEQFSINRL